MLVLAADAATEATWPLAREVYAKPTLLPRGISEEEVRILAGDAPGADAATPLKELSETRSAIHGDDAPSRQLLASIATRFHVRGIVVVNGGHRLPAGDADAGASPGREPTGARVYLTATGAFDAARYAPDTWPDDTGPTWTNTVHSLERSYGTAPPQATPAKVVAAPPREARRDAPQAHRPFYTSPWFWGAFAAAAVTGGAIFLGTRDASSDTIHLQMQVPR